jgi:hypothetical protein
MQMQSFVTEVIEAVGGIVEPVEYALCRVMIPQDYAALFQGREEILLAFDVEVAQENTDAEFITFGSYLFEQLVKLATKKPVCCLRYGIVDNLSLYNASEKIKTFLQMERGTVEIIKERKVMIIWVVFTFRIRYDFDEQIEMIRTCWFNTVTGQCVMSMEQEKDRIFYELEPIYEYPIVVQPHISQAFETAYGYIHSEAMADAEKYKNTQELEVEIKRLRDYYGDLYQENLKRMQRKNLSEERKNELLSKNEALLIEKEKQISEMANKYQVKVEVALDHGMFYLIPHLEFKIRASSRSNSEEKVVYFNAILRKFF